MWPNIAKFASWTGTKIHEFVKTRAFPGDTNLDSLCSVRICTRSLPPPTIHRGNTPFIKVDFGGLESWWKPRNSAECSLRRVMGHDTRCDRMPLPLIVPCCVQLAHVAIFEGLNSNVLCLLIVPRSLDLCFLGVIDRLTMPGRGDRTFCVGWLCITPLITKRRPFFSCWGK